MNTQARPAAETKPGRRPPRAVGFLGATLILGSFGAWGLIDHWESGGTVHLTVYADRLAGGLPTVCSGLTRHVTTTPIIVGERWTLEKCGREESAALERVQQGLLRCFRRAPPQSVFDAATSHAWNVGHPNTCGSAAMSAWNAGQWSLGCQRIARSDGGRPVWSSVRTGRTLPNGKPEFRFVQGVFNRREDEVRWCLTGVLPNSLTAAR